MTNEFKLTWAKFSPTAKVPTKRFEDAGYDVFCDHESLGLSEVFMLQPHETKRFDSNVGVVIPEGYVGVIKERSSTGRLTTYVGAGVIDSGYRHGIGVYFSNASDLPIQINLNKAIAQMVIFKCEHANTNYVEEISPEYFAKKYPSNRGLGREGSSGK